MKPLVEIDYNSATRY